MNYFKNNITRSLWGSTNLQTIFAQTSSMATIIYM